MMHQINGNNYCSLLQENPKVSPQNIEDNFDGNLCRCTGKITLLRLIKIYQPNYNFRLSTNLGCNEIAMQRWRTK